MKGSWKTMPPAPTLKELKRHYDRYGLDKVKGGHRRQHWVDRVPKTWHQLAQDSLIEVALFFLGPDEVLELVAHVTVENENNDKILEQAREELTADDDAQDDVRKPGGRSKRGGVSGADGPKAGQLPAARSRGKDSGRRKARR